MKIARPAFEKKYYNTEKTTNFKCFKCGYTHCDVGELRAAGGFWSKIFNIQGRKFNTISYTN
ncbi:MAG: hypothetical protein COX81_00305 [Candidatus Magasanikbacteria bacterium CG_4_10_14_0_2_um_filter_37_12]|uniref:Uncharacterized protein n=1 Tax=Candidatus Magasanikbacteria bacterium CG_4_10_14_0_2_um_filter_37_12 TaxID=1974637 RepID=A0A2M7VA09_9BACT|nr:MAG: hypothetical protein COX81_00305 [Candidatus Magasanikbacteria bacterium CG_4_10_14_0_2_um_filter_37_12]